MEYRRTASLRRQLDRIGIGYTMGNVRADGHVTDEDHVTAVGEVEFWEDEDGVLRAYSLPMTTARAVRAAMDLTQDQEVGK